MEQCTTHEVEVHRHIQHIIEHYKRSAGGGGARCGLPEMLSCRQIDAILAHVSKSAMHGADHSVVPVTKEDKRIPKLLCETCGSDDDGGSLTLAVEDAYLELVEQYAPQKEKQSPWS